MQLFVRKEASGHDGMQHNIHPHYTKQALNQQHNVDNNNSYACSRSHWRHRKARRAPTPPTKQHVRAIARSKQRLLDTLNEISPNASEEYAAFLTVTEAAVLDLSDEELENLCSGCGACVSCLGHNMTFQGVFGKPRRLVTDAAKRMCHAIETNQSKEKESKIRMVKFILMGSTV